jgi:hypothetical protein
MTKVNLVQVEFKSNKIEVVEESQLVVVKDICISIGVDPKRQISKINSDCSFDSQLIKANTNGGIQEVFCIPLSQLNGWLFSINPNKVKPEVKQKLIDYKKECFNVLFNHFNPNHQAEPYLIDGKDPRCIIGGHQSTNNNLRKQNETLKGIINDLVEKMPR